MKDIRIRRSQTALKQALLDLMKKKNYSRITITELCKAANLNRSTFYANYADLQALLLDIHTDLFHEMSLALKEHSAYFQDNTFETQIASITGIITYLQNNQDIFRLLLTNNEDNLFEKHLSSYYMEQYIAKNADYKTRYTFLYHAIGSFTLVHQWIKDQCPCPAKELAELIYSQAEKI